MASVADDRQAQTLVRNFLVRKHLLETCGQIVEFRAVRHVVLQDSRAHLNIFDVPEQTSIQVLLESVGRDSGLMRYIVRLKEIVARVFVLVVHGNRVLDVVAARRVLIIG